MKNKIFLFLIAGILFLPQISFGALTTDDFNRADSSSVGGSWTERDASGILSISGNKLRLNTSSDVNGDILVSGSTHNTVKITFTMEVITRNTTSALAFGVLGATGGGASEYRNLFGAYIVPRSSSAYVQFLDTVVEGSTTAFTFDASTTYNIELLIFPTYARELRVWATSGSRPTTPTVSAAAKTPTAAGTNYKIGYDNGGTSASDIKIDDFVVQSIASTEPEITSIDKINLIQELLIQSFYFLTYLTGSYIGYKLIIRFKNK